VALKRSFEGAPQALDHDRIPAGTQPAPAQTGGLPSGAVGRVAVDDMDVAARFFQQAFGFQEIFCERGMAGQIQSITGVPGLVCDLIQMRLPQGGPVLELIAFRPANERLEGDPVPVRPGAGHIALAVSDLAAARQSVEALGAAVIGERTHFDDGPAIYCRVPGGAFIELAEALPR
jgi:predicted enzyme related to lactoylglutathione lyase